MNTDYPRLALSLFLLALLTLPASLRAAESIVPEDYGQNNSAINQAIMASLQSSLKAMEGDPEAQYQQGLNGLFAKDLKRAVEWFKLAAEKGHKGAMYYLGVAYLNGEGIEKDQHKALDYLSQSAEAGNADAQAALGTLSYTGIENVLSPNANAAFIWYLKAAKNGHKQSQYNVAFCYYQGVGTNASQFPEAYAWAKLATEPAEGQQCDPKATEMVQYFDSIFNEDGKKYSEARYNIIKDEVEKKLMAKKSSQSN